MRLAAIPLIILLIAIVSTKILIWMGYDFWLFHLPKMDGFWSMVHEARADLTMLLGCLYVGGGTCSLDARLVRPRPGTALGGNR